MTHFIWFNRAATSADNNDSVDYTDFKSFFIYNVHVQYTYAVQFLLELLKLPIIKKVF